MGTEKENRKCSLVEIKGMHCASCSARIDKVVGDMAGMDTVSVNLATGRMEVGGNRGRAGL